MTFGCRARGNGRATGRVSSLHAGPSPTWDGGFPNGTFRIDATAETAIEHVGGDELLFVDGRSRQQPFVC